MGLLPGRLLIVSSFLIVAIGASRGLFARAPSGPVVTVAVVQPEGGLHGDFLGLLPGDRRAGALIVTNHSDGQLAYTVTVLPRDGPGSDQRDLRDVLQFALRRPGLGGCAHAGGALLYAGSLGELGRPRGGIAVAGGDVSALCFSVELPAATGNDYQGAQADLAFAVTVVGDEPAAAGP